MSGILSNSTYTRPFALWQPIVDNLSFRCSIYRGGSLDRYMRNGMRGFWRDVRLIDRIEECIQ